MSKTYVVSVECMVIVESDSPDAAADSARDELEQIAFDVIVKTAEEY